VPLRHFLTSPRHAHIVAWKRPPTASLDHTRQGEVSTVHSCVSRQWTHAHCAAAAAFHRPVQSTQCQSLTDAMLPSHWSRVVTLSSVALAGSDISLVFTSNTARQRWQSSLLPACHVEFETRNFNSQNTPL